MVIMKHIKIGITWI